MSQAKWYLNLVETVAQDYDWPDMKYESVVDGPFDTVEEARAAEGCL